MRIYIKLRGEEGRSKGETRRNIGEKHSDFRAKQRRRGEKQRRNKEKHWGETFRLHRFGEKHPPDFIDLGRNIQTFIDLGRNIGEKHSDFIDLGRNMGRNKEKHGEKQGETMRNIGEKHFCFSPNL